MARPAGKAVLIDLGGGLIGDYLPAAAAAWGTRLGISQQVFLAALFGGSALFIDDTPGHVAAAQALGLAGHRPV